MTVSYLNKIKTATKFNPEGGGYDYQNALNAGYKPDDSGHWSSIDNRTGMVLKGRNHPTWNKTVQAETGLGNTIVKSDDGRYYSVKLPSYLSKIKRPKQDFQDTHNNWQERADRDFKFAMENDQSLGFVAGVKEDWGNANGLQKKIPFFGGIVSISENLDLMETANRIKNDSYRQFYGDVIAEHEHTTGGLPLPESMQDEDAFIQQAKKDDKKIISDYLKYISADKDIWYKLERGVSVLPTWMIEFAATGGLASLGDDVAVKAGEKLLGHYAKTTAGKLALRTAGWSAGAATRSFGLSHKIGEQYTQQVVDEVLGLKEETGWATKLARAWGDVYIESLSEEAGEGITKGGGWLLGKLPFGSKMTEGLYKVWYTSTGGSKGEFLRKMSSKAGYSNILGEIGEERLGTTLRAIADVDDFGEGENSTALERLKAGWVQDVENIFVEIGVLSVPMGAQYIGGRIINREKIDRIRQEIGAKTEEMKAKQESIETIHGEIDTEIGEPGVTPAGSEQEQANKAETSPDGTLVGIEETTSQNELQDATDEALLDRPIDELTPEELDRLDKLTTPQPKPKPTTVEDANLSDEVDNVTAQLITWRADPSQTSARQSDLQEDRASLGLDGVPSPERKGWQKSLQEAKDGNHVDNALRTAAEINDNPRPLNDVETAGLVIKAARLKNEHSSIQDKISKATEPTAIQLLNTQAERIEAEFETLTTALHKSGTEKGRALASQKLTIDQSYDLISVVTRAKAKRGKELTQKQRAKFEKLTSDLEQSQREIERLRNEVSDMMANSFMKKGVKRYRNMDKAQIEAEQESLVSQIQQLLDEGC